MDVGSGAIIEGPDEALKQVDKDLKKARGSVESQLERIEAKEVETVRAMTIDNRKRWANEKRKRRSDRQAMKKARRKNRRK